MPRLFPTALRNIFADYAKDINFLLIITFPTVTALHVASGELIRNLTPYDNDISSVGQIRQSAGAVIDTVEITLEDKRQNYTRHFADYPAEWIRAEAVLYRRYYKADLSSFADAEVFRGAVVAPADDDKEVTFTLQIVPDTISRGRIVANRTLANVCQFIFKDPKTCAYTGTGTVCDHQLKSDCTRYVNTHHFGGMQTFSNPIPVAPGGGGGGDTGGDTGGGGGGGGFHPGGCPALDQFVLAIGKSGIFAKEVRLVKVGDYLVNPLTGNEERVKSADIIEGGRVFEVRFENGTATKASGTHPLIEDYFDKIGTRISCLSEGDIYLTRTGGTIEKSEIISITEVESQAVMKIETDGKTHIYASGASRQKMAVCHNNKPPLEL